MIKLLKLNIMTKLPKQNKRKFLNPVTKEKFDQMVSAHELVTRKEYDQLVHYHEELARTMNGLYNMFETHNHGNVRIKLPKNHA